MRALRMLTEIQRLLFDRSHFARFLGACNFDPKKGALRFKEYLEWRKSQNVD